MLSELQNFCLDAMGLSHGLAPQKQSHAALNSASNNSSPSESPHALIQKTQAPPLQSIKRMMPKIEVPDSASKHIVTEQPTGIAPKEIQNLEDWTVLQRSVADCQYCQELSSARSQILFGSGNEQADLMIISEAPNNDEDIQGHPFVGKAGELLDNMLTAIGIKREQTFITNVIKCQPPNNRDPHKNESEACSAFLNAQINHIKPKLILALGRIAAHHLLNVKTPVGQLRGVLHQHQHSHTKLLISYHPAYLLRNPYQKQKSWDDLKQVYQQLQSN